MDDRRLMTASWREAGRTVLARSGKLLFGLGMTAALPRAVGGARKDARAEDDADARKVERRDTKAEDSSRDNQRQSDGNEEDSGKTSGRTTEESQGAKDRSENRGRREERAENDAGSVDEESSEGGRRSVTRKQEADASEKRNDRSERQPEELEQNRNRDDEPAADDTVDDVVTTPTVPSNPNIPVDTTRDPTDADLFIEANPDVIASTSTSGGFAFARSGNVIAISGPDGAQIVQTDDPDAVVTPSPEPDAPADDGGNNDIGFTS